MTCNSAADCKFLSSFRTPSPYALSFLHANHTRSPDGTRACGADAQLLRLAVDAPVSNGCGGTKARALSLMRDAVRPQYRQPLRWGMKNPHATYYANALRDLFPCMVMVNTVRDLAEMGRSMKHYYSRALGSGRTRKSARGLAYCAVSLRSNPKTRGHTSVLAAIRAKDREPQPIPALAFRSVARVQTATVQACRRRAPSATSRRRAQSGSPWA
eukprot:4708333-Prymnesium_polylepis.1